MDAIRALATQVATPDGLRVRQGEVVSVSNYGVTVTIAGATTQIPGVKYLGSYAPRVGSQVWLLSDGSDMFAIGHLAPRGVPALRVTGAATSVVTATETALAFNAEVGTDPWGMWDSTTNQSRVTVPLDGWYAVTGGASFAANATGIRSVKIRQGGSTSLAVTRVTTANAGTTELTVATGPVLLAATNYVELTVEQTSGGGLDVTPVMGLHYVGPAE